MQPCRSGARDLRRSTEDQNWTCSQVGRVLAIFVAVPTIGIGRPAMRMESSRSSSPHGRAPILVIWNGAPVGRSLRWRASRPEARAPPEGVTSARRGVRALHRAQLRGDGSRRRSVMALGATEAAPREGESRQPEAEHMAREGGRHCVVASFDVDIDEESPSRTSTLVSRTHVGIAAPKLVTRATWISTKQKLVTRTHVGIAECACPYPRGYRPTVPIDTRRANRRTAQEPTTSGLRNPRPGRSIATACSNATTST